MITEGDRYRAYVANDLIPAIGSIRLDDLGYPHIVGLVHTQLTHGRGRVTVHQILATLSSALGDAVRHHRLATNPARPTVIPRPAAAERHIWTPQEAVRFLRYCHAVDPPFADLIELLIGTGTCRPTPTSTAISRPKPPATPSTPSTRH
ncbi:hypothetical protein ACFU7Y_00115 [Kitasatospora sp. NPDC057542]|uniref:hypothetical protein n=1 Tax=Streptomycetaceae TaxID=2062 RepID=UPI001CCDC953|nr:hypothetical protein [Streptomyces sp. LS1784]